MKKFGVCTLALAVFLGMVVGPLAEHAHAVIKPDIHLGGVTRICKQILRGKITAVDGAVVSMDLANFGRAQLTGEQRLAKVDLSVAPELAGRLSVGSPAVIFVGKKSGALIHVGDTISVANEAPAESPPVWKVDEALERWKVFPGPTSALVAAMEDMHKSKSQYTDHNSIVHWFISRYRKVIKLPEKPAFLACGDVNGDGIPDVLAGLSNGVQLHLATSGGYETAAFAEATADWGLAGAKGQAAALADANGDGKLDLVLGGTLYLNEGGKFAPTRALANLPAGKALLAAGIGDLTDDGKADVVLIDKTGHAHIFAAGPADQAWQHSSRQLWTENASDPTLAVSIDNWGFNRRLYAMAVRASDVVRYPLHAADGQPSPYVRLASEDKGSLKLPIQALAIAAMHLKCGDSGRDNWRASLMIFCDDATKDIGLINRGYGCFVTNGRTGCFRRHRTEGHKSAGGRGKQLITIAAAAAGEFNRQDGHDELVFATEDGQVYLADNPYDFMAYEKEGLMWVNETP